MSRRQVLRAGAWGVPVVALAVAAPRAAVVRAVATIPARSSVTSQWIGYYSTTATTEVLFGSLTPASNPAVPFVSLTFS